VQSAPAAHLVLVRPAEDGQGLLVSHLLCSGPPAYVPPMPLHGGVLAIDMIQAITSHVCPPGQGDQATADDPSKWVTP
jgi:hypothetical protein